VQGRWEVRGRRVLDAGCGPGLYAEELVSRGAGTWWPSTRARSWCGWRKRLGPEVEVRVHDLADPLNWLPDGCFDVAVMALVLHHLDDAETALRELYRVLGPGGRLVISTVRPTFDWRNLGGSYFTDEFVEETWPGNWQVRYRRAPLEQWCAAFASAGFVIERLVEPRPIPAMQQRYSRDYVRLSAEPAFIAFSLARTW